MSINISDHANSSMRTYILQLICSSRVTGSSNLIIQVVIIMWRFFRNIQSSLVALGRLMVPVSLLLCLLVFRSVLLSSQKFKRPLQSIGGGREFVYLLTWMTVLGQILISAKHNGFLMWCDMMYNIAVLWPTMRRASGCQSNVGGCWVIS